MVQILLANAAIAEHSSLDFSPNGVHRHLQQRASIPEGPAEPSVSRADLQIASAVMLSNRTGWKSLLAVAMSVLKMTSECGGSGCGCFSLELRL